MKNPIGYAKRFSKPYSRALSQKYRAFRIRAGKHAPGWAAKVMDYFDLFFVDHHIFRAIYANRHEVALGVWRSAQPSPAQIAYYARKGIKTIVNLRGERDCGSYRLQVEACRRHGIKLVNFPLRSRMVPTVEVIHEAKKLFNELEYPILLHCKSGADRAGLMAAFFMYMKEGKPIEEAVKQLSLKFGHFKKSDTGVLDYLFERYMADNSADPMTFFEWLETRYDPAEIKRDFKSQGWANLVVNRALQRE
ncbi:MAG: fused DSP-PTPase phosphatase/NAD kinase-like protein [Rhodomicrobium sp.]